MNMNDKIYDRITNNFTGNEFFRSQTAKRHNINNIPEDKQIYHNIEKLTKNILQPVRDNFGMIRITSGYRSKELNAKIGGSIYSNHCIGQAADIELLDSNVSMLDVVYGIYLNCDFRELICEYGPDGGIHVAYREDANIKQLKIKDDEYNYKTVTTKEIFNKYNGNM